VVREPLRGPLQRLSLVDNRNESVVWTDTVLGLECHKLLGIGRKARLLSPEEHEHAPSGVIWSSRRLRRSRTRENMANPFCGP
jgi:hypothetical protein